MTLGTFHAGPAEVVLTPTHVDPDATLFDDADHPIDEVFGQILHIPVTLTE